MSLGNLSIKVTADISTFSSSMAQAAQSASSSMAQSSSAVADFQAHWSAASAELALAAQAMDRNLQDISAAVQSSAQQQEDALAAMQANLDQQDWRSKSRQMVAELSVGLQEGFKSYTQSTFDWLEKQLLIWGVALAIGVSVAVVGALALMVSAIDTVMRMLDGSFFVSPNIEALIKTNAVLLDLQSSLRLSAIEAGAFNETLKRLDVSPGDYKAVYADLSNSIRANGAELDRLGVQYKDVDGAVLNNRTILSNARTVLDSYTEGWSRNQAAVAIGMGSYAQITSVLKVSSDQVQISKDRLEAYQLGMSASTQAMVAAYKTAMREFDRENDLAAQGFTRVYADAVMPIYTDMANLFKEGWPSMVRATRVGVASIMSLVYAMADGIYIAWTSIKTSFALIHEGLSSLVQAAALLVQGDVAGAQNALAQGWENAGARVKKAGQAMVDQVMHNHEAMKVAWAADGRDAALALSGMGPVKPGKDWVPAPAAAAEAPANRAGEAYLSHLARQVEQIEATRFAMMRLEATQKNVSSQAEKYITVLEADFKQKESTKKLGEVIGRDLAFEAEQRSKISSLVTSGNEQAAALIRETELLGLNAQAQRQLTESRKIDVAVAQAMALASADTVVELLALGETLKGNVATALQATVDKQNELNGSWQVGAIKALEDYNTEVMDVASQTRQVMTQAFQGMEDALVKFVTTGKNDFGSLVDSIVAGLIRLEIQKSIMGPLSQAGGLSGAMSWLSGLFAQGGVFGTSGVSAFAQGGSFSNSVVSSPTLFPFADGVGLMGEAGPEAIMPLSRDSSGALGVKAAGLGGSQVVVNIMESPGQGGQQSRSKQNGVDTLTVWVERIKNSIAGDINQGAGSVPAALNRTYGLNRTVGSY